MLREPQALALIVRAAGAVEFGGAHRQGFEDQARNGLAVFEQERGFVAAHFEHATRSGAAGFERAKARIEAPGVVHAKLTDRRIDGRHFGGL